jgi:hypothetical protein
MKAAIVVRDSRSAVGRHGIERDLGPARDESREGPSTHDDESLKACWRPRIDRERSSALDEIQQSRREGIGLRVQATAEARPEQSRDSMSSAG